MRFALRGLVILASLSGATAAHAVSTAIRSLNNPIPNYYYIPPASTNGSGYAVNIAGGLIQPSATPGHWQVNNGQSGTPFAWQALLSQQLATKAQFLAQAAQRAAAMKAPPPKLESVVKPGSVVEFDMTGMSPVKFKQMWRNGAVSGYHNFNDRLPTKIVGGQRYASIDGGRSWGKVVQMNGGKVNKAWYVEAYTPGSFYAGFPVPVGKVKAEFRKGQGGFEVRVGELGVGWRPLPSPTTVQSSSGKLNQYVLPTGAAGRGGPLVLHTSGANPGQLTLTAQQGSSSKAALGVLRK